MVTEIRTALGLTCAGKLRAAASLEKKEEESACKKPGGKFK